MRATSVVALTLCCLLGVGAPRVAAGAPADAIAAELAGADPDPLAIARVVARHGDAAVLVLLEPTRPVEQRLLGLRAAPWLAEGWRALPLMAAPMGSRDSELAPAAAASLSAIVRALQSTGRAAGEVDRQALCGSVPGLQGVQQDAAVRQDVRLAAGVAAHLLGGVCGTGAPDAGP